jgi:uncharacterized protein (DUF1330 family)
MPKAYLIVQIEIRDVGAFQSYMARADKTVFAYGGRFLARAGRWKHLEGDRPPLSRNTLVEFPSFEQALAWYESEAYSDPRRERQACTMTNYVLLEGLEGSSDS